jgi:ribose transport system permease protein
VRTSRHVLAAYVVSSATAGLAGVLLAGYAGTATVNIGDPYLLPAVAAVIVGGAPLRGGGGSVVASALAALFLTQLVQITLALGAPTSSQLLVQSLAIVLAVLLRSARLPALRSSHEGRAT